VVMQEDDALTDSQELFAHTLVRLGNASEAYRVVFRVEPHVTRNAVTRFSTALLELPKMVKRIRELRAEFASEIVIDIRETLAYQYDIATANPNDIVHVVKRCCRYCYGVEHRYQWVDDDEYMRACVQAIDDKVDTPSDAGGYGFLKARDPVDTCPECCGVGHPESIINDTTKLTTKALRLYKGVDVKNGQLVVLMHDQMKAWENVIRMLGGYNDKLNIQALVGGIPRATRLPDGAMTEQEAARSYLDLIG
jgi:phage terminase small subunit